MDKSEALGTSLVLLESFRNGDAAAGDEIFIRYFERLTLLARSRLSARVASRVDPEDVVMSAYRSFFIAVRDGSYVLGRGGDLWRLLAAITKHKLLRQNRRHRADRRSVDRELSLDHTNECQYLSHENEPRGEDVVALADELECVLMNLDPFERRVMELRLQSAALSEIAMETGRSERTVRRALGHIRERLAERMKDD